MKKSALTSMIYHNSNNAIHLIRVQCNNATGYKNSSGFFSDISGIIRYNSRILLSILCLILIIPLTANAHRGAKGEIDTCRISVGKEVIHFSAYTPALSGGRSFCHIIPEAGLTDLVIDYEGSKLRQTTVEFEVTKEPEGTRVYYHSPEQIKKGTINAKVDFRQHGVGNYLLHVTVLNEGETIDSHLPFSVGLESEESAIPYKILIPFIIIVMILSVMAFMSRANKKESSPTDGSEG
ncbi:hypothetical protein AU255_05535 [Methyloprofundus sedimenti]|uniref:Uncharacterized protein n=1 Tax=Methyloprofundus sedimenti TaxID=1420851 RepID=A0A1V8M721_9GAMM|nr:hypothetical protein [Methyloprofundus sedimenti]OQK17345.1 hypothetical protein AU255_05535 [Methyloprofundus sedimenti]